MEIVLAEAAARGDEKVVCILDQNMEYAAGTILGTEITASLREAGFMGIIIIRSANDDPTSRKMYLDAGASGYLSKDGQAVVLAAALMKVYSRAFRMGLCKCGS